MDGFEDVPAEMRDEPPSATTSRRGLRIALIVAGSVLAVSGLLVVGMFVWLAAGISAWGSNK